MKGEMRRRDLIVFYYLIELYNAHSHSGLSLSFVSISDFKIVILTYIFSLMLEMSLLNSYQDKIEEE